MPENPGALVYGTILVAALMSAETAKADTYVETVAAVLVVLVVYWLALAYADFTGERVKHAEHFHFADFARQAVRQLPVLYGAIVPLVAILICWLAGATVTTAIDIAIWAAAAMVVAIEVVIGIQSDLRGADLVRQTTVGVILGLGITALRVLLH